MDLIKSIIMGIVQGIAEFLPISSSGHLAIFKQLLNINTDTGLLFDIMLHFGTLVAIFIAFFSDIKQLIIGGFSIIGRFFYNIYAFLFKHRSGYKKVVESEYDRFVMLIIVSTIPTGIIGILLKDFIEKASENLLIVGSCLIITAILLKIADKTHEGSVTAVNATYKKAGLIGIAQGIATMPGISRSGTTITACLRCGFTKDFAVRYSFIMSIPAILGAVVLDIPDLFSSGQNTSMIINYSIGTVVAGIVGYICVVYMIKLIKKKDFSFFTIYCSVVGLLAIVGYFIKG